VRVAFLGNGVFGLPALEALARSRHTIAALVTRPDREEGRGRRKRPTLTKVRAGELELPVLEIDDLESDESAAALRALEAGVWAVVAFPIIPDSLLSIPPAGTINLHASLLPKYRGAAPVQWALINGEEVTGVTTFFIDAGIDTGAICLQREVVIDPRENAGELSARLARHGAELLVETIDRVEEGTAERQPQDTSLATPAPRLQKEDGLIDWQQDADRIVNRIRGLTPWPGAYTFLNGERMVVLAARRIEAKEVPWENGAAPAPGTLAGYLVDGTPIVSTGQQQGVALLRLQRESRAAAPGADVIRGMHCECGECFSGD
jgi:methionyl-tRNA formyltransferase